MIKVVDFWASWCGPCKMMAPTIEKLQKEFESDSNVVIEKVNIEEEENMAMAKEARVNSIPTLVFYKDGVEVNRLTGLKNEAVIREAIDSCLNN